MNPTSRTELPNHGLSRVETHRRLHERCGRKWKWKKKRPIPSRSHKRVRISDTVAPAKGIRIRPEAIIIIILGIPSLIAQTLFFLFLMSTGRESSPTPTRNCQVSFSWEKLLGLGLHGQVSRQPTQARYIENRAIFSIVEQCINRK